MKVLLILMIMIMIISLLLSYMLVSIMLIITMDRFVLKGAGYNPMDVLNCLMTRRGYKVISETSSAS